MSDTMEDTVVQFNEMQTARQRRSAAWELYTESARDSTSSSEDRLTLLRKALELDELVKTSERDWREANGL